MNAELRRLVSWLAASRLSLNESKTQLILFHSTRQHHHAISSIILYNFLLESIKLVIYLGIKIEENYSWNKQTENLSKNLVGQTVYYLN